jgi:hypothetical protein
MKGGEEELSRWQTKNAYIEVVDFWLPKLTAHWTVRFSNLMKAGLKAHTVDSILLQKSFEEANSRIADIRAVVVNAIRPSFLHRDETVVNSAASAVNHYSDVVYRAVEAEMMGILSPGSSVFTHRFDAEKERASIWMGAATRQRAREVLGQMRLVKATRMTATWTRAMAVATFLVVGATIAVSDITPKPTISQPATDHIQIPIPPRSNCLTCPCLNGGNSQNAGMARANLTSMQPHPV